MYGVKVGMSMPCSHWMYTLLSHISPAVMPQVLKTIYSETDTSLEPKYIPQNIQYHNKIDVVIF